MKATSLVEQNSCTSHSQFCLRVCPNLGGLQVDHGFSLFGCLSAARRLEICEVFQKHLNHGRLRLERDLAPIGHFINGALILRFKLLPRIL